MDSITVSVPEIMRQVRLKLHVIGGRRAAFRFWLMCKILVFAAWIGGVDRFELEEDESGVIRAGYPSAVGIAGVLLDGKPLDNCLAAMPGFMGWAECYTGHVINGEPEIEKFFGKVEIVMEEDDATDA